MSRHTSIIDDPEKLRARIVKLEKQVSKLRCMDKVRGKMISDLRRELEKKGVLEPLITWVRTPRGNLKPIFREVA